MKSETTKTIYMFKDLKERWTTESPAIFKKITNVSIILGGAAFGILVMNGVIDLQQYGVAPIIFKICGYVLVACGAMGLTSKITKQD